MNLFGFDPGEFIQSLGGVFHSLVPGGRIEGFQAPPAVAGGGFQAPVLVQGGGFTAPAMVQGGGFNSPTLVHGGFDAPVFGDGGPDSPTYGKPATFGDPYAYSDRSWAVHEAAKAAAAAAAKTAQSGGSSGVGGMDFGTPDVSAIDRQLGARGARNPAIRAETIQTLSAKYGVPVAVILAVLNQESGYGTDQNQLTANNNFMGYAGGDQGHGEVTISQGGQTWHFTKFATPEEGLDAAVRNMAGDQYKNLNLQQFLALYLTGKTTGTEDYAGGNQTADYVNNALQIIRNLGGTATAGSVVTRPAGSGRATGKVSAVWGGQGDRPITQEFGPTDYSAGNPIYDYGSAYGVSGHTGIDIGMNAGSQVFIPADGVVETAGGTAYYRDEDENPAGVSPPGQGELRIRMNDGSIVILGHMRSIGLQVGQRVTAGQLAGLSGSANGGHVHLEVRVPDRTLSSGYRIVDPRSYFGG